MTTLGACVAVILLVVAGCLGPNIAAKPDAPSNRTVTAVVSSGLPQANRTAQQFYVVLIEGGEHAKRLNADPAARTNVCEVPWVYDLDRNAKTIRFDARLYPVDAKTVQVLVLTHYDAPTLGKDIGMGCASKVSMAPFAGRALFHGSVRPDLKIDLVVEPQNGFFTYNASYYVPMGKKIHLNFTRLEEPVGGKYEVVGDYDVVNLGPWNRTGLTPVTRRA